MNKYYQSYENLAQECFNFLENILERDLTYREINGIKSAGSLMMLESYSNSIFSCKTKEDVDFTLSDIMNCNRLKDYIEHFKNNIININLSTDIINEELILQKGNSLELMMILDYLHQKESHKKHYEFVLENYYKILRTKNKK